jgi:hypothetical protein
MRQTFGTRIAVVDKDAPRMTLNEFGNSRETAKNIANAAKSGEDDRSFSRANDGRQNLRGHKRKSFAMTSENGKEILQLNPKNTANHANRLS